MTLTLTADEMRLAELGEGLRWQILLDQAAVPRTHACVRPDTLPCGCQEGPGCPECAPAPGDDEADYRDGHPDHYGEPAPVVRYEPDPPSRARAVVIWALLISACLAFWVMAAWVAAEIAQGLVA